MNYRNYGKTHNVNVLVGLTLASLVNLNDELLFETTCGRKFQMLHHQDCCENVCLEEVVGDLDDLVGSPIVEAEDVDNEETNQRGCDYGTETWTFYKLGTAKGFVTLRWYGSSNGYYSESVSFEETT